MIWLKLKIKKKRQIAFEIIVICFISSIASAQGLYRTYTSPSQLALGNIKAIGDDPYSLSANLSLSGLSEAQSANFSVGILNSQFLAELKTLYIGAYLPGKNSRDHFRFSIGRFGFSAFNIKILDLAYAREINDKICISANFAHSFLSIDQYGSRMGISLGIGLSAQLNRQTSLGILMNLPKLKNEEIDIYSSPEITLALRHRLSDIVQLYSGFDKSYVNSFNLSSGICYKIQDSVDLLIGFSTEASSISFGVRIHNDQYLLQLGSSFAFVTGTQLSLSISHHL